MQFAGNKFFSKPSKDIDPTWNIFIKISVKHCSNVIYVYIFTFAVYVILTLFNICIFEHNYVIVCLLY